MPGLGIKIPDDSKIMDTPYLLRNFQNLKGATLLYLKLPQDVLVLCFEIYLASTKSNKWSNLSIHGNRKIVMKQKRKTGT